MPRFPDLRRYEISLICLGVFLACWLLRAVDLPLYLALTAIPDGVRNAVPFVDLGAVLQAGACWRQGVDVYLPSACLGGGVYNYAPLLLRAAYLPIGPADTGPGGVLLCLGFCAALARLPVSAARGERRLRLAATVSTTSFYALEQGNLDAAIFIAAALALPWLLLGQRRRFGAYAVFLLAAGAKFYPAALLFLALRERLKLLLALVALSGAAALLYLLRFGHGTATAIRILPSSTPFRATFGQIDLPRGFNWLHILTATRLNQFFGAHVFSSGAQVVALASWLLCGGALAASLLLARRYAGWEKTQDPARLVFLLGGVALLVLCFFAAQNVYYRAIFLLFTLPGLYALAARLPRFFLPAIVLLLWEAPVRALLGALSPALQTGFWLLREALWWWVIIHLAALLLAFAYTALQRLYGALREIDARAGKP
jgi:hypothetical protein